MEELNEETLNEVTDAPEDLDAQEAVEELTAPEELDAEDTEDVAADDVDENHEEETDEQAENQEDNADANRDALRKFIDLHQLLGAFHQRVTRQDYRDRGRVLGLLQLKDGIETKGMAQILGIHVPELNAILEKLETEKLIVRESTDAEKRWATVTLTEAGRNAKTPSENITEFLFDGFTDEELNAFAENLDRITKNLENELGQDAATLLKEQRMRKAAEKPEHGRSRDDRGGFRKHDDRGGFRKHDDRGGFRKRDDRDGKRDRGPRRNDKGGFKRNGEKRGGFGGGRGGRGGDFGDRRQGDR